MRLLVLGASGQVGSCVLSAAAERGQIATGTYRSHARPGLVPLDLLDRAATDEIVRRERPDWIVACATWAWVDGNQVDPERATRENVSTVENAASAALAVDARFCYLSTSYVFDGRKSSPYTEDDPVSPTSVYAETKVRSEAIVREAFAHRGLVARTIVVYGPDPQEKNFFYQVVAAGREGRSMRIPKDQTGNPTYGPDLASALVELLARGASGTWNIAGPDDDLDRVEFARLICEEEGLDFGFIEPVATEDLGQPAPRPLNGSLSIAKLRGAGIVMRSAAEVLGDRKRAGGRWPASSLS